MPLTYYIPPPGGTQASVTSATFTSRELSCISGHLFPAFAASFLWFFWFMKGVCHGFRCPLVPDHCVHLQPHCTGSLRLTFFTQPVDSEFECLQPRGFECWVPPLAPLDLMAVSSDSTVIPALAIIHIRSATDRNLSPCRGFASLSDACR